MQVETYTIRKWNKPVLGLLISENEDWILTQSFLGDYLVDGFQLLRKQFVTRRRSRSDEEKVERVLALKELSPGWPEGFEFGEVLDILHWSEGQYGLFLFQDEEVDSLFAGKYKEHNGNRLVIDFVDANGEVDEEYEVGFNLEEIRAIAFETDYFNSVRLMMEDNLERKTR